MQIEIVSVSKPYTEGKYPRCDVEYVREGKNVKQKLTAVGDTKAVIQELQQVSSGDHVEIELKKNGDYWNWVGVTKLEGAAAPSAEKKSSYQKTSTYETAEERARKQVYIARQSSISAAVNLFGSKAKVPEILQAAQTFVDFVMTGAIPGESAVKNPPKDDIPF